MESIRIQRESNNVKRNFKRKGLNLLQLSLSAGVVIALLISGFIGIFSEEKINDHSSSNINEIIETNEDIQKEKIKENLGNIKGYFTKNQGQIINNDIYFTFFSNNIKFAFLESSVLIEISKLKGNNTSTSSVIKLTFENSNNVIPHGIDELVHKTNYFIGNDSSDWNNNVLHFKKLVYKNLYDGIDLIYYFDENGLKYDWIIHPYADPTEIVEIFQGVDSLKIDINGALIINTKTGQLKEEKPFSYQKINKNNIEIGVNFEIITDNKISYNIGEYDITKELIIDPSLIYSTYIGGTNYDEAYGIALDNENNAYITGITKTQFTFKTTPGCYDDEHNGYYDVFVFKLHMGSNGDDDMIYSTYVGGANGDDYGWDIALDSKNNVYVSGWTESDDFPTTPGCYESDDGGIDVFAFKLNMSGSGKEDLVYSTYIGGSNDDGYDIGGDYSMLVSEVGIELDSNNNVYLTGLTKSIDFPITIGSYNDENNGGIDVFVCKLKMDGKGNNDLLYSSYLGGESDEISLDVALDSLNNIYITGFTNSKFTFPTTSGCYDDSHNGEDDIIIFKLNMSSKGEEDLLYSTYIGGNNDEGGRGIALDKENNVYITGGTDSTNFPTTQGCYEEDYSNGGDEIYDVIVLKITMGGNGDSDLVYSTYFGGTNDDKAMGHIAVDSDNIAYVTGFTNSTDFPTTPDCYDETYNGGEDTFIIKMNLLGNNKDDLLYSSYIGGIGGDSNEGEKSFDITLDAQNNVYIVGSTKSDDFPTTPNCFDDSLDYTAEIKDDAFIFKLNLTKITAHATIDLISSNPANELDTVNFYGNGTDSEGTIIEYYWYSNISGFLSNDKSFEISTLSNGTHKIYFKVKNNKGVWSEDVYTTLVINGIPRAKIDDITPNPANEGDTVWFIGNYIDFEDNILEFYWESDIDGYLSSWESFSTTTLSNGTHTITFKVKDDNEAWSETVSTILTINGGPRSKINEIKPNPADEGENIWFYGNGTDDGTIEDYEWSSSIDGFLNDDKSFSLNNLSTGRHTIYFKVKDNYNIWSETISEMLVIGIPKAIINEIGPHPTNENEKIWFYGNGTKGWIIDEYYWHSSIDGFLNDESSFYTTSLSNGTHTISYKVKDNYDIWSEEVSTILTINGIPRAKINDINPNFGNEGEEIWFYGIGKDDNDVKDYYWSSSIDGFLSNETEFILSNLSNGTHTIYFKVRDNNDVWSEEDTKILIINSIPIAEINEIKPNIANEGEMILFNGTGTDDMTIDDYYWSSNIDGFLSNEKLFNLSNLSFGIHTIYFKVKDNNNVWSEEVFMTLIINGIPKAVINEITPNPVLIGKSVFFYGNGTDDGSIVNYNWSNFDGFLSSEKSFSLSNLSIGTHTISFKVQDNMGIWSGIVTEILIIRDNKIPIPRITSPLDGEEFYENVTIHFDATKSTDEDFDLLIFNWMLNNEKINTKSKFEKKLEIGKYSIELKLDDGFGGLASAFINISVESVREIFQIHLTNTCNMRVG